MSKIKLFVTKLFILIIIYAILIIIPYCAVLFVILPPQTPKHFFKNFYLAVFTHDSNAIGLTEPFFVMPVFNKPGAISWVCGNVGKKLQKEIVIIDNTPVYFDCVYYKIIPICIKDNLMDTDKISVTIEYDNGYERPIAYGDMLRYIREGYETPYPKDDWYIRWFVIRNLPEKYAVQCYLVRSDEDSKCDPKYLKYSLHVAGGFDGVIIRHHPARIIYIQSLNKITHILIYPITLFAILRLWKQEINELWKNVIDGMG